MESHTAGGPHPKRHQDASEGGLVSEGHLEVDKEGDQSSVPIQKPLLTEGWVH